MDEFTYKPAKYKYQKILILSVSYCATIKGKSSTLIYANNIFLSYAPHININFFNLYFSIYNIKTN